ncbi:DUF676 domain-containing protein [Madurella fahalii]|uniref:DUF676 domain-containing protein n=1 Tax=Madurella fahalii TaxID=1157608 RepID=A0ABQ0GJF3_9PEZI
MADKNETFGIEEVYRPPSPIEPEVDIVAVHGLNGGARSTWTAKAGVCWLDHPQFLPKYIKNARVLVWGYNADFTSLDGGRPSKDRIHHHAHTLVANLAADRRLSGTADKPIIFLCHSLGGIIVKRVANNIRALTYAQTRTGYKVSHDYHIFSCTYGILFFGTPHHGSSPASWLDYVKKLGAAATAGIMSKSDLVSALENESETLQNITDYFVPIMRNFNIFFFWEQEPTSLGRLGRVYVVTHESAAPTYDETERAAIAADHRGMVRFDNPESQGFRMVMDALLRYCDEAPSVIRQRCVDAARSLGLERSREATETLRRNFHPREVAPHVPAKVESGLDGFPISGTSRSGPMPSICGSSNGDGDPKT